MKKTALSVCIAIALGAAAFLPGCGGGSGDFSGGGGGGGVGGGRVAVFVTDSMDNNDHLWVTLYSVALNSPSGSQTVFTNPDGTVVDLKTLRDEQGAKFQLLNVANTQGTFSSATVTIGKNATVFGKGAFTGTTIPFADEFDDGSGKTKLTFAFAKDLAFGNGGSIVIDFDLFNWKQVNGKIVPVLKENDKNGLGDERRHVTISFEGTVANLTGEPPNQSFDLMTNTGAKLFQVRTTSSTAIFNADQREDPRLENGARVHVQGLFHSAQGGFTATSIMIQNGPTQPMAMAAGVPRNVDTRAATFKIAVRRASGFIPREILLTVTTDEDTVFRSDRGVRMDRGDFFAKLEKAGFVEVHGAFDSGSGSMAAARAKLSDVKGGGVGNVGVKGLVTDADKTRFTFMIKATNWRGFSGFRGLNVFVKVIPGTVYRNRDNVTIESHEFFSQLDKDDRLDIEGKFTGGGFKAETIKFEN